MTLTAEQVWFMATVMPQGYGSVTACWETEKHSMRVPAWLVTSLGHEHTTPRRLMYALFSDQPLDPTRYLYNLCENPACINWHHVLQLNLPERRKYKRAMDAATLRLIAKGYTIPRIIRMTNLPERYVEALCRQRGLKYR